MDFEAWKLWQRSLSRWRFAATGSTWPLAISLLVLLLRIQVPQLVYVLFLESWHLWVPAEVLLKLLKHEGLFLVNSVESKGTKPRVLSFDPRICHPFFQLITLEVQGVHGFKAMPVKVQRMRDSSSHLQMKWTTPKNRWFRGVSRSLGEFYALMKSSKIDGLGCSPFPRMLPAPPGSFILFVAYIVRFGNPYCLEFLSHAKLHCSDWVTIVVVKKW